MISREILGKNVHSCVLQRPQIALVLYFEVFEKLIRACFLPNCTQNNAITYTNSKLYIVNFRFPEVTVI